jgi:RNA polymerase sigma-70 factor (ECF subfamily)
MMARGDRIGDRGAGGARGEPVAGAISPSALYAEHAAPLRAYLVALTRDGAAAEDLVHEAFVRLLAETGAGRPPLIPRAWLFRVATNLAVSRGRRRNIAARRSREVATRDTAPSPEDELLQREARRQLDGRLAGLPPHARAALVLAAHGYSGPEIARLIGRSELATRSLLCRYRGRLRTESAA